jgi:AraC family transcriptional regulator, ethanolamine operon transcriptional activator
MSFFERLAHQISANAADPARKAFSVAIMRAGDVDEFVDMVRDYRLGFMQIEKGPFSAEAVQTRLAGVLLSAAHYGRAMVQLGEPPPGKMTFAVRTSSAPALWQGRGFGPHDLLAGTPGVEMDLVSQASYSATTASFPLEFVKETADRCGWICAAKAPASIMVRLEPGKADMLRATLGAVFSEAIARPFDDHVADWALRRQEDLLRALLRCMGDPAPEPIPISNGERARVLKAALAAINDQPDDVLTVGELCRLARSSERTLDYAFTERFGLAPARYMKARRLNGARNDLSREQDPSMKIADIANKWGFWHLGQFAKDYRSWFGELPSDTYERKHGRFAGHDHHGEAGLHRSSEQPV